MRKPSSILPFAFENWAVIAPGGIPHKMQVGGMGVDVELKTARKMA